MDIQIYASGSTGNCYKISDGTTSVLLDCGIPVRAIQIKCNFNLDDITACLVSHSHKDHSKAATELARLGVDIYTSEGTIADCGLTGHRIKAVEALKQFKAGTFNVMPFDVQHDAPDPLGFLIESTVTKDKLLYFTDSFYIKYRFTGLTHIMAECNYDKQTLDENTSSGVICGELRNRILRSHMSLEHLKANDLSKVRQVNLMHLSKGNSNEKHIKAEMQKLTGTEVYVC